MSGEVVPMTLDEVTPGQKIKIIDIPDQTVRAQAIRFGIGLGAEVVCQEKLPGGPVVLRKGFQEIAVGRNLARQIRVNASWAWVPGWGKRALGGRREALRRGQEHA